MKLALKDHHQRPVITLMQNEKGILRNLYMYFLDEKYVNSPKQTRFILSDAINLLDMP